MNETAKYVARLALTLLLITSVVAAVLAGVNMIAAPKIAEINAQKLQNAIEAVLPGGYEEEITEFPDETGLVSRVYQGENGYALEVAPGGFGGTITMMVGVSFDGKVLGVCVISHGETPGLGAVAAADTAAGGAFRGQFVDMGGSVAVTKDGGKIEAVTGATITSRGICDGVNAALACVAGLG